MKVSFLCNSFLAFPSAQFLYEQECLAGLASSSQNPLLGNQLDLLAQDMQIPYASITPKNITSDITKWLHTTQPDIVVVQTFPHLIPASCLQIPPMGFYNIHPSPLPLYRGPDPIFWQIKNGEQTSGVSLHKMEATFDTGPIFHIESIPLESTDTYGLTQSNLSFAAVELLKMLVTCTHPHEQLSHQSDKCSTSHSKAKPDDLIINWPIDSASAVHALVRACNPHQNGAITFFRDVMTRILEANIQTLDRVPKLPAGTVIAADNDRGLQVICTDELALELSILHVEEGYYSGRRFCEVFQVGLGEKFCNPSFLS